MRDVDGVVGVEMPEIVYQTRNGPVWRSYSGLAIPAILEAATAIACGLTTTVLVATASAGVYTERASTAPWTRPNNQYVAPYGMFTAAEFALIARRHMHRYGTTPEQIATVAATIRNNGHVNPDAVYSGRGPFDPQDVLDSRLVADPFHLLDCSMTSEGGCGMLLTTVDRARDTRTSPVFILGGNTDTYGNAYRAAPAFDLGGAGDPELVNGWAGRRAARHSFAMSGLSPTDVDTCEFYDPFSFEIIRQFESFGFCKEGEGGPFAMGGTIEVGGEFPVTTDGGCMSFSHAGATAQLLQRVIRGVQQLRGECRSRQVDGAEVALCTGGGAGAMFTDVLLLGTVRP
jgi:acetyl-CoA acetyltransferase